MRSGGKEAIYLGVRGGRRGAITSPVYGVTPRPSMPGTISPFEAEMRGVRIIAQNCAIIAE